MRKEGSPKCKTLGRSHNYKTVVVAVQPFLGNLYPLRVSKVEVQVGCVKQQGYTTSRVSTVKDSWVSILRGFLSIGLPRSISGIDATNIKRTKCGSRSISGRSPDCTITRTFLRSGRIHNPNPLPC